MTIIQDHGETWIELLEVSLTLQDAADRYFSPSVNLERAGNFRGVSCVGQGTGNNDNSQAVGSVEVRTSGGSSITFGQFITAVNVRVTKQVGTAGALVQSYFIMVYMGK